MHSSSMMQLKAGMMNDVSCMLQFTLTQYSVQGDDPHSSRVLKKYDQLQYYGSYADNVS